MDNISRPKSLLQTHGLLIDLKNADLTKIAP